MNKDGSLYVLLLFFIFLSKVFGQNGTFDTSIDRYASVPKIVNSESSKFSVEYYNWYKVITNMAVNQSYVVTYGQQPRPTSVATDSIFIETTNTSTIGVTGVNVVLSYLELLGLQNRVQYSDSPTSVTSTCYNSLTGPNTTTIMFSNTTNGAPTSSSNTTTTMIAFSPDETMTPLEQSSWIMYISYFFDLEETAYRIYQDNIQGQYLCHKDNLVQAGAKRIAITRYVNNQWSLLQNTRYYSTLITEAGMTPFNGTMDNLHTTDFVIDVSPISSSFTGGYSLWLQLVGRYDPNIQTFTNAKNVFRIDGLVNSDAGIDWFERSPSRPDLVIQDVIHMVYPTYESNYQSTWLRNFAKGDTPWLTQNKYPICGDMSSIFPGGCRFGVFLPNGSNNDESNNTTGLSTGGKIGIAVGVIIVIVGISFFGFYLFRKKQNNPDHTFYKMNDI